MAAFIAAVLVVIAISIGAAFTLERFQSTADRAFQTGGVRIDTEEAGFGHRGAPEHAAAAPAGKPVAKP